VKVACTVEQFTSTHIDKQAQEELDAGIAFINEVQSHDEASIQVWHQRDRFDGAMSDRDHVTVMTHRVKGSQHQLAQVSVDHPRLPPEEGVVRMKVFRGYIAEMDPSSLSSCLVTCVVHADPALTAEDGLTWTDATNTQAAEGIMDGLKQEALYAVEHAVETAERARMRASLTPVQSPACARPQVDISGTWELVSNVNYPDFLAMAGASSFEAWAANKASMKQFITHTIGEGVVVDAQSTFISTKVNYIFGTTCKTSLKGRDFEDMATETQDGITIRKLQRKNSLEIIAVRVLQPGGDTMVLTTKATFLAGSIEPGKTAEASQTFRRVG